jgi:uncharacterized membrane protein
MTTRIALGIAGVLILAAAAYSAVLYPQLPNQIPIHWNARGQIDGWGSKDFGLFLMPGIMAGLLIMFVVLPWLSPQNFKVESFSGTYNYVALLTIALMGYCHVIIIETGRHPGFDAIKLIVSGMFAFVGLLGGAMGKVRRNFWMGFRTPWTLANEKVWESCHHFAAHMLVVAGIIGIVAVWLGVPPIVCFVLFMVAVLAPVLQSLIVYKRLEREGNL